jgi:hypothetical protein
MSNTQQLENEAIRILKMLADSYYGNSENYRISTLNYIQAIQGRQTIRKIIAKRALEALDCSQSNDNT